MGCKGMAGMLEEEIDEDKITDRNKDIAFDGCGFSGHSSL